MRFKYWMGGRTHHYNHFLMTWLYTLNNPEKFTEKLLETIRKFSKVVRKLIYKVHSLSIHKHSADTIKENDSFIGATRKVRYLRNNKSSRHWGLNSPVMPAHGTITWHSQKKAFSPSLVHQETDQPTWFAWDCSETWNGNGCESWRKKHKTSKAARQMGAENNTVFRKVVDSPFYNCHWYFFPLNAAVAMVRCSQWWSDCCNLCAF